MPAESIEWRVETECGRLFVWSAPNYDYLLRDLHERGYKPTFIKPYDEFLAEIEMAKAWVKESA